MRPIPERDETELIWLMATGSLGGFVLAVTVFFTIYADNITFLVQPTPWYIRLWFLTLGASFAGASVASGLPHYGNHLKRQYRKGKFTRPELDDKLRANRRAVLIVRFAVMALAGTFVYSSIIILLSSPLLT